MNLKIVDFETAKKLKDKSFDWPTIEYYNSDGNLILNYVESHGEEEFKFDAEDFYDNWNDGRVVNAVNNSCWGCTHQMYKEVYSAPGIMEVVLWLYEKHGIWIYVACRESADGKIQFVPNGRTIPFTKKEGLVVDIIPYTVKDSPTEAYEAAINHCLNNLI